MKKRKNVVLTEDESAVIVSAEAGKEEGVTAALTLVGSLLTSRPFNADILNTAMRSLWKVRKGFLFTEMATNCFSFQFADKGEKERVLNGGPWSFDNDLLLLREPGDEQPSRMRFESCAFWVRLYDMPIGARNLGTVSAIAASLGQLVEVDQEVLKACGRFVRLRVMLNVTKPLRRGVMIMSGEKKVWVEMKYERLPNFCYSCGRLGHVDWDCDEEAKELSDKAYGDWLRVLPVNIVSSISYVERQAENQISDVLCNEVLDIPFPDLQGSKNLKVAFHHSTKDVIVHFRSLERPKENVFFLELSKINTYDEVVEKVAQQLRVDNPSKIRLTSHNCYSQQPKPQPIKFRGVDQLSDMLAHYNQTSGVLYYEVLDIPLPELRDMKALKVAFHHATKDEVHNIRLPKQCTVKEVISKLKTKVKLSHPDAELRLLEVFSHKIYKIFSLWEKIENKNDQYWTLRAEEIPEEEENLGPDAHLIHVYHFTKETSQNQMQVRNFGDPFLLVIREGETLDGIKDRIQKKLHVTDEEFAKWKFALLSLDRPVYLQDTDIVYSCFQSDYGAWEQYLGLEHTDTTPKRAYTANQVNCAFRKEPAIPAKPIGQRKRRKMDSSSKTHKNPLTKWSEQLGQRSSSLCSAFSDPPLLEQTYWLADSELLTTPSMKAEKEVVEEVEEMEQVEKVNNQGLEQVSRRCTHCQAQKTPQWRPGPTGLKTLCNACGMTYKKFGSLLPEYRPVNSPTFMSFKHSNSQKKVLQKRMPLLSSSTSGNQ